MSRILTGRCLCEAIRFQVPDEFRYALNCHCSQCRRTTGSAFKAFAGIEAAKLTVTEGSGTLLRYGRSDNHDARCSICGSFLYSLVRNGSYVHVNLGALADAPSLTPTAHIYVGSKAPWHEITDSLPQHLELP
jgi:hypothetical protein